jgi:hypothetical protein
LQKGVGGGEQLWVTGVGVVIVIEQLEVVTVKAGRVVVKSIMMSDVTTGKVTVAM